MRPRQVLITIAALVVVTLLPASPARAVPSTWYVNGSKASAGAGGSCASPDFIDLVAAVEDGDVQSGDTLHVCKGLYRLSAPLDLDGENKNLTFVGDGKTKTTLDGRNLDRIVDGAGQDVVFVDIKLIQGRSDADGGAVLASNVTLTRTAVSLNRADNGGAIYATGNVTLTDALVSTNMALDGDGGGIYAEGNISVTTSSVMLNTASGNGAGLYAEGNITLSGSTIERNTAAADGGGAYTEGDLSATDSTLLKNVASGTGDPEGNGGGAYVGDDASLAGASIVRLNTATNDGGGLYVVGDFSSVATRFLSNTARLGDGGGVFYGTWSGLKPGDNRFNGNKSHNRATYSYN